MYGIKWLVLLLSWYCWNGGIGWNSLMGRNGWMGWTGLIDLNGWNGSIAWNP